MKKENSFDLKGKEKRWHSTSIECLTQTEYKERLCMLTMPTFRSFSTTSTVGVSRCACLTILLSSTPFAAANRVPISNSSITNSFGICIASEEPRKHKNAKAENYFFGHSYCGRRKWSSRNNYSLLELMARALEIFQIRTLNNIRKFFLN